MKLKVFSVPSSGDEQAEASLNHFLASHRIAQIDRQLVSAGGGSWINNAQNCRSANRNTNEPSKRNNNIGLRFAQLRWDVDVSHVTREPSGLLQCTVAMAKCSGPLCSSSVWRTIAAAFSSLLFLARRR